MATDAHQVREPGPEEAPGLSAAVPTEAAGDLAAVRGLAWVMDSAFTIPGTRRRVGLDPLLGFIPVIGDLGSAAIGGYILLVASRLGVPAVVVLGDPAFYTRFGFRAETAHHLESPWSGPHLMAIELIPGALAAGHGVAHYPAAFTRLDV